MLNCCLIPTCFNYFIKVKRTIIFRSEVTLRRQFILPDRMGMLGRINPIQITKTAK